VREGKRSLWANLTKGHSDVKFICDDHSSLSKGHSGIPSGWSVLTGFVNTQAYYAKCDMAGLRDLSMSDAVFKSEQNQNNGIYNTQTDLHVSSCI